jgi:hypothetical protein
MNRPGLALGLVALVVLAGGPPPPPARGQAAPAAKPKAKAATGPARPAAVSTTPRPPRTVTPPTLTPAQLDALIDRTIAEAKAPVANATTDDEFLRRVALDLTGRPPAPEEVVAFRRSKSLGYRARLIDEKLRTPEFARNLARYWRDVIQFRATNDNAAQIRYDALENWLAEQFAKNAPWDAVAAAMIAGTGPNDASGAVNFTLAHNSQPVELAGEVSRIFLGIQISCAQCHDHPDDAWKRQQFHEFAAFFAGTRSKRTSPEKERPEVHEVTADGPTRYAMPDLDDPKKQVPVAPKFFVDGGRTTVSPSLNAGERRALAAALVTGQDNPWFARAFVNRAWQQLLGEGFYAPVDDLGPARTPRAQAAMDELAGQWQRGGYDVRWLYATIMNTKAYQRQSRSTYSEAGRAAFAANIPGRLRADVIYDSLVGVLKLTPDNRTPGAPAPKAAAPGADPAKPAPAPPIPRDQVHRAFGVDPSTPTDDILGSIPQALFFMNNPQLQRALRGDAASVLGQLLAAQRDDRLATEALYLRVLGRRPSVDELNVYARYLTTLGKGKRREAYEDLLWALINSTEFLCRR